MKLPRRKPWYLVLVAVLLAGLPLTGAAPSAAAPGAARGAAQGAVPVAGAGRTVAVEGKAGAAKPTIVLVHGANADSSSWSEVILRLQRRGYPVIAFANPLRSLSGDVAALRDLLATVPGPVVLVAHSYGGMIISVAADGNPNVKSLVVVDGHLPLPGETAAELTNKFPGSQFGAALVARPITLPGGGTGTDLYVDPAKYRALFTGPRISEARARMLAAIQRPVAEAALTEPATAAAWRTIPTWNVIGTKDVAIPRVTQLFMARRAGAHITEIPAPHVGMLTFPGPITRVIEAAAR
jgi:pimeloyl-ACP methyl ester carboxylesterase